MALLAIFDSAAWIFAVVGMALVARPGFVAFDDTLRTAILIGLACALVHFLVGLPLKLHQGRAAVATFEDAVLTGSVALATGLLLVLAGLTFGPYFRTSVALSAPVIALTVMMLGRAGYRLERDRGRTRSGKGATRTPVVLIGAGEASYQLVTSMLHDPEETWIPKALVDDDHLKRHRRIRGVPVEGRINDLVEVAQSAGAKHVVLAIPSASRELVRSVNTLAREGGLDLKVLPGTADLLDDRGGVNITDVRDISVADLLGRSQIDTDVHSIADYLTGRKVLVTGAGGSIGSELCRQIARFNPSELMMLDRDESALHAVELSISGQALLDTDATILGDLRDEHFVNTLFAERAPDVVFHAAALKHLPLLEKSPGEAVKTNVWGTLSVLRAAQRHGVSQFVNISTDKAANPSSVLGYSKRLAEGLTSAIATQAPGSYISVRFGNVLGSRGSVLTTFAGQIANGGPITVTDPGVTRYFMTIAEACQLVIQAGALGDGGEVLVLDMGEPVSIDSVARQLIELSGDNRIDIVYTGLRPGEKMHEELFGSGEVDERPRHPLISHTPVPLYSPAEAEALDAWAPPASVTFALERACAQMLADEVADPSVRR